MGGDSGWVRNTEYFPYRVVAGDILYFEFNNVNDTVYLMENKVGKYYSCTYCTWCMASNVIMHALHVHVIMYFSNIEWGE